MNDLIFTCGVPPTCCATPQPAPRRLAACYPLSTAKSPINGCLKHLRGSAPGYRNPEQHILRRLLYTGPFEQRSNSSKARRTDMLSIL